MHFARMCVCVCGVPVTHKHATSKKNRSWLSFPSFFTVFFSSTLQRAGYFSCFLCVPTEAQCSRATCAVI